MCKISVLQGQRILGVEPPTFVELEIVSTEPGFAGNTATNTTEARDAGDRRWRLRCRCSSTRATSSKSIREQASIWNACKS